MAFQQELFESDAQLPAYLLAEKVQEMPQKSLRRSHGGWKCKLECKVKAGTTADERMKTDGQQNYQQKGTTSSHETPGS